MKKKFIKYLYVITVINLLSLAVLADPNIRKSIFKKAEALSLKVLQKLGKKGTSYADIHKALQDVSGEKHEFVDKDPILKAFITDSLKDIHKEDLAQKKDGGKEVFDKLMAKNYGADWDLKVVVKSGMIKELAGKYYHAKQFKKAYVLYNLHRKANENSPTIYKADTNLMISISASTGNFKQATSDIGDYYRKNKFILKKHDRIGTTSNLVAYSNEHYEDSLRYSNFRSFQQKELWLRSSFLSLIQLHPEMTKILNAKELSFESLQNAIIKVWPKTPYINKDLIALPLPVITKNNESAILDYLFISGQRQKILAYLLDHQDKHLWPRLRNFLFLDTGNLDILNPKSAFFKNAYTAEIRQKLIKALFHFDPEGKEYLKLNGRFISDFANACMQSEISKKKTSFKQLSQDLTYWKFFVNYPYSFIQANSYVKLQKYQGQMTRMKTGLKKNILAKEVKLIKSSLNKYKQEKRQFLDGIDPKHKGRIKTAELIIKVITKQYSKKLRDVQKLQQILPAWFFNYPLTYEMGFSPQQPLSLRDIILSLLGKKLKSGKTPSLDDYKCFTNVYLGSKSQYPDLVALTTKLGLNTPRHLSALLKQKSLPQEEKLVFVRMLVNYYSYKKDYVKARKWIQHYKLENELNAEFEAFQAFEKKMQAIGTNDFDSWLKKEIQTAQNQKWARIISLANYQRTVNKKDFKGAIKWLIIMYKHQLKTSVFLANHLVKDINANIAKDHIKTLYPILVTNEPQVQLLISKIIKSMEEKELQTFVKNIKGTSKVHTLCIGPIIHALYKKEKYEKALHYYNKNKTLICEFAIKKIFPNGFIIQVYGSEQIPCRAVKWKFK